MAVRIGLSSQRSLDGIEHSLDGAISYGMDCHLIPGSLHFTHYRSQLLLSQEQIALRTAEYCPFRQVEAKGWPHA
jgi:hypothetical protein